MAHGGWIHLPHAKHHFDAPGEDVPSGQNAGLALAHCRGKAGDPKSWGARFNTLQHTLTTRAAAAAPGADTMAWMGTELLKMLSLLVFMEKLKKN